MILQARIFENSSTTYTESLYQHDKNVTLVFDGIDLPGKYEVHFSNEKERGISVSCEGDTTGVKIPDALLSTGEYVYAWVCDAGESTGNGVVYTVVIPVIPRPVPVPVQISSGSEPIITNYEVNADEENLTFTGYINGLIERDKEIEEGN